MNRATSYGIALSACLAAACGVNNTLDQGDGLGPQSTGFENVAVCASRRHLPVTRELYCETDRPRSYTLNGACHIEEANPTRLLFTADDTGTGSVGVSNIATRTVQADLVRSEIDSLPFYHNGLVFVLHRYGFDRIDIIDPARNFARVGQHSLRRPDGVSSNPHGIAFRDDWVALVTEFGSGDLALMDFCRPPADSHVGDIDLRAYADGDGRPEMSLIVACGDTFFVTIQRLTPTFDPTDAERIVAVDGRGCTAYPDEEPLLFGGFLARQVRKDPTNEQGALFLTTGIERVDFAGRTVTWLVPPERLARVGITRFQPQSFDLHSSGDIYLAAYREDFSAVDIWRLRPGDALPQRVIVGLEARERTLEIVGDELWFGNTRRGAEGLHVYRLGDGDPVHVAGPLRTGLPPKSIMAIP